MRVLLTGGSGFIAAHTLNALLERGHTVVTTVRSQDKADRIKAGHPLLGKEHLDFTFVAELACQGAFDAAVQSDPPFDAVVHTASPLNHSLSDVQKDVLDPAIIGTTGLLTSIARFAPTVKRVVILSSFAAMVNVNKGNWPEKTYTTADWNPITPEEALVDALAGYRGSKTFSERAAWEFVEREKPRFSLTTLNPPFVFGPVVPYPGLSLIELNSSNRWFVEFLSGIPSASMYFAWVYVKDCALGLVKAIEDESTAGERIFITSPEQYCNKDIIEIIYTEFPELREKLPERDEWEKAAYPKGGVYKVDGTRARELLGRDFVALKDCVVETVNMIKAFI